MPTPAFTQQKKLAAEANRLNSDAKYFVFGDRYDDEAQRIVKEYNDNSHAWAIELEQQKGIDFTHYTIPNEPFLSSDMLVNGYRFCKNAKFKDARAQLVLSLYLLAIRASNFATLKILFNINSNLFFLPVLGEGGRQFSLFNLALMASYSSVDLLECLIEHIETSEISQRSKKSTAIFQRMLRSRFKNEGADGETNTATKITALTERLIDIDANLFSFSQKEVKGSKQSRPWSPFLPVFQKKLIAELEEYCKLRSLEKTQESIRCDTFTLSSIFYRFFETRRPYSADEKINVTKKLIKFIQDSKNQVSFTSKEVEILENGRLGKIYFKVTNYFMPIPKHVREYDYK